METDEDHRVVPFQLQFEKPVGFQIKIAEWNPEKDLLAMVTEESKILLHRFNWQRLWTISPGRSITSLCWHPDGKAIAVGHEDGTISLHDVENGKVLRSLKLHTAAVVCLNWEEDLQLAQEKSCNASAYEDRTPRFFPPAPRVPRVPGLVSGDSGFMDDNEESSRELFNSSHRCLNILCSGDNGGSISFSIFGIFPIGKIDIHKLYVSNILKEKQPTYTLLNASIQKAALSKDLCSSTVLCSAELQENVIASFENQSGGQGNRGLHCLLLDTSIFFKRKNELRQVAQQASSIEDLNEVIRASLSVMSKQWSDAMHIFHEKFNSLPNLIIDHGLDSSPQEEFLSLLGGARTSPPIHQFLVNSLGEAGVKRVSKVVSCAGKELQHIVLDHLQPAAEIIGFRLGELRGLSRRRARYQSIGLDESLLDKATERSGMMLVQVERFMRVLTSVVQQFSNFFNWLLKCIKLLMQEPSDQLLPYNSELVVIFIKFLYDHDPVKQLLELNENIEVDPETTERVKELVQFGGFTDFEYLRRTLTAEFQQMETSFKEAFMLPFTTISRKILCGDLLPLFPLPSLPTSLRIPMSVTYYEDTSLTISSLKPCRREFVDYITFRVPDESFSDVDNCIGIARGFTHDLNSTNKVYTSFEAVLLSVPAGYQCIDLSLYKESQIVLLLNATSASSESSGDALLMIVQASDLPFVAVSRLPSLDDWKMHLLKDYIVYLQMENQKVRSIPHSVVAPLAVSASRGVGCVFAARKRALVYILEEDEDEVSQSE